MHTRLLAAAAAISISAAAAPLAAAAHATATIPTCRSSQLQPHYDGDDGAAGTLGDMWHFTNLGARCQTIGFVGALNFGADGRPLPTAVHWVGAKHTIVLAHGQKAHWEFYYQDPGITGCTPEAATRMIVTPPNNTNPVLAGRGVRSCHGVFNATPLTLG